MTAEEKQKLLKKVWSADSSMRYVPRAYSSHGPGWGVYDALMGRFVDERLAEIDVYEPLVKS